MNPAAPVNAMILPSVDGQDFATVILYPADWPKADADAKVKAILIATHAANPDDWNWDDAASRFTAAGFTLPAVHLGPTWDDL